MNLNRIREKLKVSHVAVLKGGWSRERPISLKTAAAIEASLRRQKIPFKSIDVKENIDVVLRRHKVGFAFLALHGTFGEDGGIQTLLDLFHIPYTGENSLVSAIAMDKQISKVLFHREGVPTARGVVVSKPDFYLNPKKTIQQIHDRFKKIPLFVKPSDQGSALGVSKVTSWKQLPAALNAVYKISNDALVEEFIDGRELTVGILGDEVLPVVEIIPQHSFYDFHSKYAKGGSKHLVPAPLSITLTRRAQSVALKAFKSLGAQVYGRVDLLMSAQNKFYVLELNTIPGMTATSLLPDAARAAGIDFDSLILKIAGLSLSKRAKN